MDIKRRFALEHNPEAKLTQAELAEGYHFCPEWDGMLIGHKDAETQACTCPTGLQITADGWDVSAEITLAETTPKAKYLQACFIRGQTIRLTNFPGIAFYIAQQNRWLQNTGSDSGVAMSTYSLRMYCG